MATPKRSTKKAVKKRSTAKKVKVVKKTAKKSTKRARKKVSPKTTRKKTVKKTTKKVTKKTVRKRVPKKVVPETVRNARYRVLQNTMPTNPNAPGRVLGRVISLSVISSLKIPVNGDAIAVGVARIGGVGCMLLGAALSWQLAGLLEISGSNQVAQVPLTESIDTSVTLDIAASTPSAGTVPIVISTQAAERVFVYATETAGTTTIPLGLATQQSAASWELLLDSQLLPDALYSLSVAIAREGVFEAVDTDKTVEVANTVTASSTVFNVATSSQSVASTTPAQSTTTPVLSTPNIAGVIYQDATLFIFGTTTPQTAVEVVALSAGVRSQVSSHPNGWWLHQASGVLPDETYEIYALNQATDTVRPHDFIIKDGNLYVASSAQAGTTVPHNTDNSFDEMLLWYLLTAVALVGVGAVLLLLGHHLHHTVKDGSQLQPAH